MWRRMAGAWVVVLLFAGFAAPVAAQVELEPDFGAFRSVDRDMDRRHGRVIEHGRGHYEWVVSEDDVFGIRVDNTILFDADKRQDGTLEGRIFYRQQFLGNDFLFLLKVTCMEIYEGKRIKIGGFVEATNDPDVVGLFGWFQAMDNGKHTPAWSTLVGFGDEEANEAFCDSANMPNFGPWDVEGKLTVKQRGGGGRPGDGDDDDDDD